MVIFLKYIDQKKQNVLGVGNLTLMMKMNYVKDVIVWYLKLYVKLKVYDVSRAY
jgi:hypothetical protein